MFTAQFLSSLFPYTKGKHVNDSFTINEVTTDSRKKTTNGLFIPLIGERFDAHAFIDEAVENGAKVALWQKDRPIPGSVEEACTFFRVEDTKTALQQLAKAYRQKVDPLVVAVTGSNGKTTTKDLLKAVLETKFKTHATLGNLNNDIGLPLTILNMPKDTEVCITEMGMNHFGEIRLLTDIARPNYAIITNIGESHIENLGSREGICEAKLEVTSGLMPNGTLIIDGDEPLLVERARAKNVRTCSFQSGDVVIEDVQLESKMTMFTIDHTRYSIPLIGKHHAKNASFSIYIARQLNIAVESIKRGLMQVKPTSMRFEWLTAQNGATLINDAYNASPTSMQASIEVVKQLADFQIKGLVLADILELGTFSQSLHEKVAHCIDDSFAFVFTYGEHAKVIAQNVKERYSHVVCKHFTSKEQLVQNLSKWMKKEAVILFKGSRGMQLEQVIEPFM